MPSRKLNLNHLSEEECEEILKVIQRDFSLRTVERERLSAIEDSLKAEDTNREILSRKKAFNENCCMRCFSRFVFIFNQKVQCETCRFFVCKNCANYNKEAKVYHCDVCDRQKELQTQSSDWFYSNVKNRFKRFGSAKVVRSLYKRKTDSDSETDSGFRSQVYGNSLPTGKKNRSGLLSLFSPDTNQRPSSVQEGVVHEDVVASRVSRTYSPLYPESGGLDDVDDVDHTIQMDVVRFRNQLHNISSEMQARLDATLGSDSFSPSHSSSKRMEDMMTPFREDVQAIVSDLGQSLLLALEHWDVTVVSHDTKLSNDQIVQDVLVKEVETFLGAPLTDDQAGKDELSELIVNKIVRDYNIKQDVDISHEEHALDHDLTKLTNRATISQLSELVSESETDDIYSNTSRLDESVSDAEHSRCSKKSTESVDGDALDSARTEDPPKMFLTRYGSWEIISKKGKTPDSSPKIDPKKTQTLTASGEFSSSTSDVDLDEMVKSNMIDDEWKIVESKMSSSKLPPPNQSETSKSNGTAVPVVEISETAINEYWKAAVPSDSTPKVEDKVTVEKYDVVASTPTNISPEHEEIESSPCGSVSTITEDITKVDDEVDDDEDPDEEAVLDFLAKKRDQVPLPGLDGDEAEAYHSDLDMDDISMHSGRSYEGNWRLGGRGLFTDIPISAYDNCGDKRLGRNSQVRMFVPDGTSSITVGDSDKNVDDLSDLSENDSQTSEDDSLGSDDDLEVIVTTARRQTTSNAAMTTTVGMEMSCQTDEPLQEEVATSSRDLPPVSTEGEETDPRFVRRPCDLEVVEGEVLHLECEVEGTAPLDVFWYTNMAGVDQLEDGENCDISHVDTRYCADVYNCTSHEAGQYLCIGINDQGKCAQSFNVVVKKNTGDVRAPEYIRSLVDVDAFVGDIVKLRCKVKGLPPPRVTWYKDGKRIVSNANRRIEKIGNRDHVLMMDYVTLDDDAEYSVVARNIAGDTKSTAQVLVEPLHDSPVSKRSSTSHPSYLDHMTSPDSDTVSLSSGISSSVYPDTEELMRIAAQISESQGRVDKTATKMMRSANTISSLNDDLSMLDKRLDTIEKEVPTETSDVTNNNNDLEAMFDTSDLVKEEQRLLAAAKNVRAVTAKSLDILSSAEQLIDGTSSTPHVTLSQADTRDQVNEPTDEETDVHFTFQELEKLFNDGKISQRQMREGRVRKSELAAIKEYLVSETTSGHSHGDALLGLSDIDPLTNIDCGLKRVDSKRYKRDYIINRKKAEQMSNDRPQLFGEPPEIIKSTPAGTQEKAKEEIAKQELNNTEEQIYVRAGQVFSLEEKIRSLGSHIEGVDETTSAEDMVKLEHEVARVVAQVAHSENEVSKIETQVGHLTKQKDDSSLHPDAPLDMNRRRTMPPNFTTKEPVSEPRLPEDECSSLTSSYDESSPDMPSVKRLRSKFNQSDIQSSENSAVTRVYSLTGRDIPRTVREKLRNPKLDQTKRRPSLEESLNLDIKGFASMKDDKQQPENGVTDVGNGIKTTGNFVTSFKATPTQKATLEVTLGEPQQTRDVSTHSRKSSIVIPQTHKSSPSSRDNSTSGVSELESSGRSSVSPDAVPRRPSLSGAPNRSGKAPTTIMARAAFWDRRISLGESNDGSEKQMEFPSLPSSSFHDPLDD